MVDHQTQPERLGSRPETLPVEPVESDTAVVAFQPDVGALISHEQVAAEVGQAEVYRGRAHAPATLRAYRSDWAHFTAYCAERGTGALPADPLVVRTYLATCADRLGL